MSCATGLLSILAIATLVFIWLKQKFSYWSRRNVPEDTENRIYYKSDKHRAYFLQRLYRNLKNNAIPVAGMYFWFIPTLVVVDLDFAKKVLISEFESFPDRGLYHNESVDPLTGGLTRIEGEYWRRLRTKLTPTFTTGKMKLMLPLVAKAGDCFVDVLSGKLKDTCNNSLGAMEVQIRDLCARYTTDVIGAVAFGIQCNSLLNPEAEFRVQGDKIFRSINPVLEMLASKYPKFFRAVHYKTFPDEALRFYSRIVIENISHREANGIKCGDFLDTLIELKNKEVDNETKLTLDEVIAQAFVFLVGGFETSSTTMTFCIYELSRNQELQEKARRCVLESLEKHNGEFSHDCLKDMQYLSQAILETLRKHPVVPLLARVCRRQYKIPETDITIAKDVKVLIPVHAIHHDPDYYPDPELFNPDRFAPEEFRKRHPMAYLPFGAGPRNCIAERFGKFQAQIGLAKLLLNFRFTPSARTPEKLVYSKKVQSLLCVNDLYVNIEAL